MFGLLDLRSTMSCRDGAMIGEELCKLHMTIRRCQIQRSQPIIVLGCCVGTMFDEEL